MIRELKFSARYVVKGYQELINRGLIGSTRGRGYYVTNGNTGQTLHGGVDDGTYGYLRGAILPEFRAPNWGGTSI